MTLHPTVTGELIQAALARVSDLVGEGYSFEVHGACFWVVRKATHAGDCAGRYIDIIGLAAAEDPIEYVLETFQ